MAKDEDTSGVPAQTPEGLREGVRQGIRDALAEDLDRTSVGTLRRLAAAGVLGLATAGAAMVFFSGGALQSAPGSHLALCSAAWASLLVECFALVLLPIRLRGFPEVAGLALLGLALAGVMGFACPIPQYLVWWRSTAVGSLTEVRTGSAASALCFGLCTSLAVSTTASLALALRGLIVRRVRAAASLLFLVLWPAVGLQSVGAPLAVFASWSVGLALGAYGGIAAATAVAQRYRRDRV